jgi:aspartyl-tRNA(Asn)/glutamyl-tRNA(Gln) amidotransferase subunit C
LEAPVLDKKTVEKVAKLARLKLADEEVSALTSQLPAVLENFNQIAQVETSGIEPLVTPSDITPRVRPDQIEESNSEKILENAPERSGRLFKVPPVV